MPLLTTLFWRVEHILPFVGVAFALESIVHRKTAPTSRGFNLRYFVLVASLDILLNASVVGLLVSLMQGHRFTGLIRLHPTTRIGLALTFLLWLLLVDFFYYWMHRAQHQFVWLWAEHEVHHSDEHMNATTNYRHHWLEGPIFAVAVAGPLLILLDVPPIIPILRQVTIDVMGPFIHMDAPWSFGWWLAGPGQHRIHHSTERRHRDKNFSSLLPVWDVLFGTYYAPGKDEYPQTGLASGERITTLRQAIVWPFLRWLKV